MNTTEASFGPGGKSASPWRGSISEQRSPFASGLSDFAEDGHERRFPEPQDETPPAHDAGPCVHLEVRGVVGPASSGPVDELGDAAPSPRQAASDRRSVGLRERREQLGDRARGFFREVRALKLKNQMVKPTVDRSARFDEVCDPAEGGESASLRGLLYEWVVPLGMVLIWLFLNRLILPQFGFPSCPAGSCGVTTVSGQVRADAGLRPVRLQIPQGVSER